MLDPAGIARPGDHRTEPSPGEDPEAPARADRAGETGTTYRALGFQLVDVSAGPLAERVALVRQTVEHLRCGLSWPDANEP